MKPESFIAPVKDLAFFLFNIRLADWIACLLSFLIMFLITFLIKKVVEHYKYSRNAADLHPYFSYDDINASRDVYVPTTIRSRIPDDRRTKGKNVNDLELDGLSWFIDKVFTPKNSSRFYLVLAESGMGKTTFLINLYIKYIAKFNRKYDIRLLPIAHGSTFDEIERIKKANSERNTILLLDAFDEDNKARDGWRDRLDEIIGVVQNFRYVVISARTQFFPDTNSDPIVTKIRRHYLEGGFHEITKWYVSPFSDEEIGIFLKQKYGYFSIFNRAQRNRAYDIVAKSPSLMVRPMLLSYIDELTDLNLRYKHTFQVYEALVERWIAREANRIKLTEEEREDFVANLMKFSKVVAVAIYRKWAICKKNGLTLSVEEIEEISKANGIQLDDLEMKSKSLLTTDAQSMYKFAHRSIWEYFLAVECVENNDFVIDNFQGLDQAKKFRDEMMQVQVVVEFLKQQSIIPKIKLYNYVVPGTKQKIKRYMRTIAVNEPQLIDLLLRFDDPRFVAAFDNLNIEDITILSDSVNYKIENLALIASLLRITLYKPIFFSYKSKLKWLRTSLMHVYIPELTREEPMKQMVGERIDDQGAGEDENENQQFETIYYQ